MKKSNIFMTALLGLGLVACNENFDPEKSPQANVQESLLKASDITVSSTTPDAINLPDYIDAETSAEKPISIGVAAVKEGAMPVNTILKAAVEVSRNADFSESVSISANSMSDTQEITIQPGMLEDAYFENITKNPSTTQLYIRTIMYTVTGGEAEAIVGKPGENFYAEKTVTFTPLNKLTIAPAYYIIGGPNDWAGSAADRSIKFQHSGEDVYIDPVFTVIFDANAGGDTWFAIGDDQACDAIGAGDWTQLYGIVGGDSEAKEGKIARRTELGGDNSFCVKAGAKKIRVTIDMMEQTFKVEAVSIADSYYLVGGPGSWSSDKSQKFAHSDKDVFEDPVFTYTFEGNGGTGDIWFAFGDAAALDAIDAGDRMQLFGYNGTDMSLSGSFERRNVLGGEYTFHVDGKAKFYRFTINALTMTYEITPLNFSEYIYEAGVNNDWGGVMQPLYCPDGNGTYVGFFYAQDADWSDGKGAFKFTGAFNDWSQGNYGTGSINADGLTGTLVDDGGSGNITVEPGFYRAEVNLAAMTFALTRINGIGIIGPAQDGGWDTDTDMTYNPETRAWEATVTLAADEFKFRANDGWDINWGGDNLTNLVQNGKNLKIEKAGKYFVQFFPLCETKSYATITAAE